MKELYELLKDNAYRHDIYDYIKTHSKNNQMWSSGWKRYSITIPSLEIDLKSKSILSLYEIRGKRLSLIKYVDIRLILDTNEEMNINTINIDIMKGNRFMYIIEREILINLLKYNLI